MPFFINYFLSCSEITPEVMSEENYIVYGHVSVFNTDSKKSSVCGYLIIDMDVTLQHILHRRGLLSLLNRN